MRSAIQKCISDLEKEIDDCEVEVKRESSKKRNVNKNTIAKMQEYLKNHHWHITHLEMILRQIDNEILSPYVVGENLEIVQEYIDSYRDSNYIFDDSVYDVFDLESSQDEEEDEDEDENGDYDDKPEEEKEKETVLKKNSVNSNFNSFAFSVFSNFILISFQSFLAL